MTFKLWLYRSPFFAWLVKHFASPFYRRCYFHEKWKTRWLGRLLQQVFVEDYLKHGMFPKSKVVEAIRESKIKWDFNEQLTYEYKGARR